MRNPSQNLIEIHDLYKTYHVGEIDVPVLKGVTLNIARGEMVALMGVSGSGKSTLMNILGCLDRPTSGEYWLDGDEISRLTADERAMVRNRKIGFVFQSFNLLSRTSALDNVIMPLTYTAAELSDREARARATAVLTRVGLGDRLDHHPSQLSGGQQQRVAIARALINNPPLLFADEPTGNLDSKTSKEVLQMFQRLNEEEGITIILVTHDAGVAHYAKRMIHIADGLMVDGVYTGGAGGETAGGAGEAHANGHPVNGESVNGGPADARPAITVGGREAVPVVPAVPVAPGAPPRRRKHR